MQSMHAVHIEAAFYQYSSLLGITLFCLTTFCSKY